MGVAFLTNIPLYLIYMVYKVYNFVTNKKKEDTNEMSTKNDNLDAEEIESLTLKKRETS